MGAEAYSLVGEVVGGGGGYGGLTISPAYNKWDVTKSQEKTKKQHQQGTKIRTVTRKQTKQIVVEKHVR